MNSGNTVSVEGAVTAVDELAKTGAGLGVLCQDSAF